MPAGEFEDWIRYDRTEPFGYIRDEHRFSILASNILAASPNKWRDTRALNPRHWYYTPPRVMSEEESIEHMRMQLPAARRRKRKKIYGD